MCEVGIGLGEIDGPLILEIRENLMAETELLDDLDFVEDDTDLSPDVLPADAPDREIERFFERGRLRVVQDRNDFFLPHVVDIIEGRQWGNLRPEYQRRLRWDDKKKSKLIESFIMNVPVPPVFLYETELGRFEVMDGQQRLNSIVDFMGNRLKLTGLKTWPALNGRNFSELPPSVRRGLERAKISAITLMSDASDPTGNSLDLRAQVFERLNSGGEQLNPQELRNSLYSGPFNQTLIELSGERSFTDAWDIPNRDENTRSDGSPTDMLKKNNLFKRMTDVEIVLRFFAFKEPEQIVGSVRSMLDNTMKRYRHADSVVLEELKHEFRSALYLCVKVFGKNAFRVPANEQATRTRLSRPYFDAQMVVMYQFREQRSLVLKHAGEIEARMGELAAPQSASYELLVGRANTAIAVRERIELVWSAVREII